MDVEWFEDFLLLVDTGGFSRAADKRELSQPAFSRRISALENWVGTPLLVRGAHRVTLTPAGERFRTFSEEFLRRLRHAQAEVQELGRTSGSELRFASTPALSLTYFAPWLKSLEQGAPLQPTIRLVVDTMTACERLLMQGQAHFVLCHHYETALSPLDTSQFQAIRLGDDPLVPLCAPQSDGSPMFTLPGTPQEPVKFLNYTKESGLSRILNTVRLTEGPSASLDQVFASHASTVLAAMARDGRGVAWVPKFFASEDIRLGRLVRAGDEQWDIATEIRLIRAKARQSPSAEHFWAAVVDSQRKQP